MRNVKRPGRHKIGKLANQAAGHCVHDVKASFEIGGKNETSVRGIKRFRRVLYAFQRLFKTAGGRIPGHVAGKKETAVRRKNHPGIGDVGLGKGQQIFSGCGLPDARSAGKAKAVGGEGQNSAPIIDEVSGGKLFGVNGLVIRLHFGHLPTVVHIPDSNNAGAGKRSRKTTIERNRRGQNHFLLLSRQALFQCAGADVPELNLPCHISRYGDASVRRQRQRTDLHRCPAGKRRERRAARPVKGLQGIAGRRDNFSSVIGQQSVSGGKAPNLKSGPNIPQNDVPVVAAFGQNDAFFRAGGKGKKSAALPEAAQNAAAGNVHERAFFGDVQIEFLFLWSGRGAKRPPPPVGQLPVFIGQKIFPVFGKMKSGAHVFPDFTPLRRQDFDDPVVQNFIFVGNQQMPAVVGKSDGKNASGKRKSFPLSAGCQIPEPDIGGSRQTENILTVRRDGGPGYFLFVADKRLLHCAGCQIPQFQGFVLAGRQGALAVRGEMNGGNLFLMGRNAFQQFSGGFIPQAYFPVRRSAENMPAVGRHHQHIAAVGMGFERHGLFPGPGVPNAYDAFRVSGDGKAAIRRETDKSDSCGMGKGPNFLPRFDVPQLHGMVAAAG